MNCAKLHDSTGGSRDLITAAPLSHQRPTLQICVSCIALICDSLIWECFRNQDVPRGLRASCQAGSEDPIVLEYTNQPPPPEHLNFYHSPWLTIDLQNLRHIITENTTDTCPSITASCLWTGLGYDVTVISGRLQTGTQVHWLKICSKGQSEGP